MLLPIYNLLTYACLYIFVHIGVGKTKHQPICPFLVYYSEFTNNGFIMIGIVETLHTHLLISVNSAGFEIFYRRIHIVVVIRIVLESIDFISKSVIESLSEVGV